MTIAGGFVRMGPEAVARDHVVASLGTALLWTSLGLMAGLQIHTFIVRFGPLGYFYTLAIALVGIGFAEFLVQGVIPVARGEGSEATDIALWGYGFAFTAGTYLLVKLREGRSVLRKVLAIFTVVGVLEFGLDQLLGSFLYSFAWFVPEIDPPKALELEFTLWMGTLAAFWVGDPGDATVTATQLGPGDGLAAAMLRTDTGGNDAPPLTGVPFRYEVPAGWSLDGVQRSTTQHTLVLRPESATIALPGRLGRTLARALAPRLYLSAMEYTLDQVADEDRLRRTTELNLAARRAKVRDDRVGTRHGVLSYECECSTPAGYAHIVTFVVSHTEVVCYWQSADADTFQSFLPEVDSFVDSLEFIGERDRSD